MTTPDARRLARAVCLAIAILTFTWGTATLLTGGFSADAFGVPLRSHDPARPVILAGLAFIAYASLGGRIAGTRTAAMVTTAAGAWSCVAALTLATLIVGVALNTTAVGGSDSFGYASEAELFLRGELVVRQPF